ncbi:MAG: Sir2 family NAD-dependent protein deacetylase [Acidobacteriota bacterium]
MAIPTGFPLLADQVKAARFVLVFTGAGLSTGSGIPDFRGPQGLWRRWQPVYYEDFVSSHEARVRHWEFKLSGWTAYRDARPNAAHLALAQLERGCRLQLLVTQNIDGLHLRAGNSPERTIELHGTNLKVECISCGVLSEPDAAYEQFAATRQPPVCSDCGGFLKPATVSFGQAMPVEKLERAFREARAADLVLAVGSTLEVEPAASIPLAAKRSGAFYAIINLGRTAHDGIADVRIEGDACEVLPELVGRL